MIKDVIVACDFPNKEETMAFLNRFTEEKPYVKIGMELFYGEGPDIVRAIKEKGHSVFLDLKLCDIPNTVHRGMKNLARLGVDMTNLHAFGGIAMMQAALEGLEEGSASKRPLLIAVTVLTSMKEQNMAKELLVSGTLMDAVKNYAGNGKEAGLDGVVCSPLEVTAVKQKCGSQFLTVTPGIRYHDGDMADQNRVTSPADAARLGSDFIVVGRPITGALDPVAAYRKALADFTGA